MTSLTAPVLPDLDTDYQPISRDPDKISKEADARPHTHSVRPIKPGRLVPLGIAGVLIALRGFGSSRG